MIRFEAEPRRDWLGRRRWYFRVKDEGNGEILAQSEGYQNKLDCLNTAEKIQRLAGRSKLFAEGEVV